MNERDELLIKAFEKGINSTASPDNCYSNSGCLRKQLIIILIIIEGLNGGGGVPLTVDG